MADLAIDQQVGRDLIVRAQQPGRGVRTLDACEPARLGGGRFRNCLRRVRADHRSRQRGVIIILRGKSGDAIPGVAITAGQPQAGERGRKRPKVERGLRIERLRSGLDAVKGARGLTQSGRHRRAIGQRPRSFDAARPLIEKEAADGPV